MSRTSRKTKRRFFALNGKFFLIVDNLYRIIIPEFFFISPEERRKSSFRIYESSNKEICVDILQNDNKDKKIKDFRIKIPKRIRYLYNINANDTLEIIQNGKNFILKKTEGINLEQK